MKSIGQDVLTVFSFDLPELGSRLKKMEGIELSVVISNRKSAYALERAREQGFEAVFIDPKDKFPLRSLRLCGEYIIPQIKSSPSCRTESRSIPAHQGLPQYSPHLPNCRPENAGKTPRPGRQGPRGSIL